MQVRSLTSNNQTGTYRIVADPWPILQFSRFGQMPTLTINRYIHRNGSQGSITLVCTCGQIHGRFVGTEVITDGSGLR